MMFGYSLEVKRLVERVRRFEPGALEQLIASSAPDATVALHDLLEDIPAAHRIFRHVLQALVKRGVIDPIPHLRGILQDPAAVQQHYVAIMAVRDYLKAEGALPMLCDVLYAAPDNITRHTRNQAACALAVADSDAGLYPLAMALHYDQDYDIRRSAAYGLSMSDQPTAAMLLLHYLEYLLADGKYPDRALQWHAQPIIHAVHRVLRRKLFIPDIAYALNVLSKWLYIYTDVPEPEVKHVLNRLPGSVADHVVEQWQQWQYALAQCRKVERIFR